MAQQDISPISYSHVDQTKSLASKSTKPLYVQSIAKNGSLINGIYSLVPESNLPILNQLVTKDISPLKYGDEFPPKGNHSTQNTKSSRFSFRSTKVTVNPKISVRSLDAVVPNGPVGTPDHYVTPNDQTLAIAAPGFLGNDIDLDGETLMATAILISPQNGEVSAFADGSFTYTPDAGYMGTDSFAYQMRDASMNLSDTVIVRIDVLAPANRNPVGTDDYYLALSGTVLSVPSPGILGNDIDPDGDLLTATAILATPQNGSVSAFADGNFTYSPDAGYLGTDSFAYRMQDDSLNRSDTVWVTIEVLEGNRAPIGVNDDYTVILNTPITVAAPGFLGNDIDLDADPLMATAILVSPQNGEVSAFANGSFTYTPDSGFVGIDSFAYRIRDTSLNLSDTVTVTLHILSGGTTPIGTPDQYAIPNDKNLAVAAPGFLGNDIDPDGESLSAIAILVSPQNGEVSAFADGSFTYTPDTGYMGTDSFAYQMRDASMNLSDTVIVRIDVLAPANRNPVGTDDYYLALSGTVLSVPSPGILGNDIDPDGDLLTATAILATPQNGSVSAFADGNFTYSPDAGYLGTDSFAYRMQDDSLNRSDTIWVTIEVLEGNRAPIGVNDDYTVLLNTPITVAAPGFLGNDIDLDGESIQATAILVSPQNGDVAAFGDGSFTYTPDSGYIGTDSFTYRLRDESMKHSDSIQVRFKIINTNFPPIADAGEIPVVECSATDSIFIILDGSGSADPEDDPLIYTWLEDGEIIAGPTMDAQTQAKVIQGSHTIILSVDDGHGNSDIDTVMVNIQDTSPPVVSTDFETIYDYGHFQLYKLKCAASDLCDDKLTTSMVIALPELNNFQITYKKGIFKRIKVLPKDQTVVVESPDPESFWEQIQSAGGFPVKNHQILARLSGTQDLFYYNFNYKGNLKSIIVPEAVLRCTATDDAGNTTIAEAIAPTQYGNLIDSKAGASGSVTGVAGAKNSRISADVYHLDQNYPNPFTQQTTIGFELPRPCAVRINIFNSMGHLVTRLVNQSFSSGPHQVIWESGDFPGGIYYYHIHAGTFSLVRQMVLIR